MYELKTEKFSGPLEKLLELIEARHLEITELSLAEVTADFLNYLKGIENVEPRLLADFVVIASRLLLIKSRALLPSLEVTEEEEAEIKDLEERLKLYREFKQAGQHIRSLWNEEAVLYSREFLASMPPVFYPPSDLETRQLHEAIRGLMEDFSRFIAETGNLKITMVSLEEKMTELLDRVRTSVLQFKKWTEEKSRSEIVVLFLAVLHLLKNELIRVEQKDRFSEIKISQT